MQNLLPIILGIGLVVAIFALLRKKEAKTDDTGLRLLLEQMNNLSRTVDQKLGESSKIVHESLHRQ
ncbi:MAG TPA: DNA recombination protein RmuC, partial [Candidatus Paceibacterota bacterium]